MRDDIVKYLKTEVRNRAENKNNKLHFDSIPSLLYLAYGERNMNIEEGKNFVKSKLERSYRKLSDESKIFYKEKFENVMKIL